VGRRPAALAEDDTGEIVSCPCRFGADFLAPDGVEDIAAARTRSGRDDFRLHYA
jgi:hypothetical protein